MDFSLLTPDRNFKLENYFKPVIEEFKALGRDVVISKKQKKNETNIESAFLKGRYHPLQCAIQYRTYHQNQMRGGY